MILNCGGGYGAANFDIAVKCGVMQPQLLL
jgi:hypothetical protein